MTREVFVCDAVRTPIGRAGGALAGVRPDDLAATAVRAVVDRRPELDPADIDDVWFGDANGAGEDNRNVARMAVLLAGLPPSVPGATVNRLCGSGMEAVIEAGRAIAVGDADVALAGGVESMSRAPWVLLKPERAYPTGHEQLWSTTLGWRMVNPRMPAAWTISLGEGAEVLADKYGIGRDEQDAFAVRSHQQAAAAWAAGRSPPRSCPWTASTSSATSASGPTPRSSGWPGCGRPSGADGTVTAGNASPLNDGAAAVVLASAEGVERGAGAPMARLVSRATAGVEPPLYGIGPVAAARTALRRAGLDWGDLAAVELNEAFAAQSLACLAEWPELDPAIVNPLGGAIAIGHPLGCSGARILTTLVHHLARTGGRYGLAAMCIGVGQGIAVVVENLRR